MRGFGAVGDRADDVEEELLAFGKRIQGLVLVELGDGDVALRVAALLLERLTLGVESVDPGLETSGGFGGLVRLGSPGQIGDPVAQGAEALPEAADISVDCAPERVDDAGFGILRLQAADHEGVEIELLAHIFEEVLLRPAGEQGAGDLLHGHAGVGGNERDLAAAFQQAADLADLGPLFQLHALLGEADGGAAGRARSMDRYPRHCGTPPPASPPP